MGVCCHTNVAAGVVYDSLRIINDDVMLLWSYEERLNIAKLRTSSGEIEKITVT